MRRFDKSVLFNAGMVRTAGDIASSYSLSSCIRCGKCDRVCPSGRNGGIHPDAVIYAVADAEASSDLSRLHAEVWKCLMCHRCSLNCPEGIDVAGVILMLRYDSASSGGSPKRFRAAGNTLAAEGRAFPATAASERSRAELGLPPIRNDGRTTEELRAIMIRTGFCRE